jgi:hypothetical protein
MTHRFISEFGLNMMADACVVLQDEHLSQLEKMLGSDAPEFHIYVIGTRPRIALDPSRFGRGIASPSRSRSLASTYAF